MLLVLFVRLRLAEVPLERDEGEYAYAGQLLLHGVPPYEQAYNMKFPGTYYGYAMMMAVLGQTVKGIRLGLLVVNLATVLLVFFLGRRLFGRFVGAIAAVSYALTTLDPWGMGFFAHATHFVVLPVVAALLLLLHPPARRRWSWCVAGGALLGVALLVKQHGFAFLPLGAWIVWQDGRAAGRGARQIVLELGCLFVGAVLPFLVMCAVLQYQGVLGKFWFWTIQYAREYVSEVPWSALVPKLLRGLRSASRVTAPLWIVSGIGLIALWTGGWQSRQKWFLTGLLLASFVAICPGFYFREHYFILMLPAVALLIGVAFASAARLLERSRPGSLGRIAAAAAFIGVALFVVARERDVFFELGPEQLSRARYGRNPFIESVAIADWIRARSAPEDRIAVVGSEPQIYFYADRRSATGYIYMYPLMERQRFAARMQEEMIHEIERARPTYIVLVQIVTSWLPQGGSTKRIVEWTNSYTQRDYDLVGITDVLPTGETRYVWDAGVAGYRPESNNLILIYRRKADGSTRPER
jgi:hypothetical protein